MKRWGMSISAQVWLMVLAVLALAGALVTVNTRAELSHERDRVGEELSRNGAGTAALLADVLSPDGEDLATLTSLAQQISSTGRGAACDAALKATQGHRLRHGPGLPARPPHQPRVGRGPRTTLNRQGAGRMVR